MFNVYDAIASVKVVVDDEDKSLFRSRESLDRIAGYSVMIPSILDLSMLILKSRHSQKSFLLFGLNNYSTCSNSLWTSEKLSLMDLNLLG